MRIVFAVVFVYAFFGAGGRAVGQPSTTAKVIKFGELESMMSVQNDTTYIFNFFATWCDPCVKEFPDFQRLSAERVLTKTKVIFISLDFKSKLKSALRPFLLKRNVLNEVYLLDEPDYNTWIDRVDSSWEGNLPATLVVNSSKHIRKLFARDFTYESLVATLASLNP